MPYPQRILVALSGGVDSTVAALLLKEAGVEVAGAYFRTWMHEASPIGDCPWQAERDSAQAAAEALGIPFEVINWVEAYKSHVVEALVNGYRQGETPNPDALCNRHIKFGVFVDYAQKQGFDGIATGHYCQKTEGPDGPRLWEGADPRKDQSYFLALVRPAYLQKAVFPVGGLQKAQVRQKARDLKLPNAEKKDSQGICFLGKVAIQQFLDHYIPPNPGPIVNSQGKVLGTHTGLHHYTLGQRKGIGVPSNTEGQAYVVVAKDLEHNRLVVALEAKDLPALYHGQFWLAGLNFLGRAPQAPLQLLGRPRYQDPAQPLDYFPPETPEGMARIHFHHPQRALAPGQVLALYQGQELLGGGLYAGRYDG